MQAHTPLIIMCCIFLKVQGPLRTVLQAQKLRWWSVTSLSNGVEYLRSFESPRGQKSKGIVEHVNALFVDEQWYEIFPLFWCEELTPQVCASINLQSAYTVLYLRAENISKNPIVQEEHDCFIFFL